MTNTLGIKGERVMTDRERRLLYRIGKRAGAIADEADLPISGPEFEAPIRECHRYWRAIDFKALAEADEGPFMREVFLFRRHWSRKHKRLTKGWVPRFSKGG